MTCSYLPSRVGRKGRGKAQMKNKVCLEEHRLDEHVPAMQNDNMSVDVSEANKKEKKSWYAYLSVM